MKYIKLYEEKHIPKFNVGDPVKIKNDKTNTIFIVDGYDFRDYRGLIKDKCRLLKYIDKDKLVNKEGMYSWIIEKDLKLAPDYEVDAIKYNL